MATAQGSAKDTQDPSTGESNPDTQKADEQADASRKAQQLGESRKAAFATLVNLAKTSPEAKQELVKLSEDEYNRTYLEEKFGENYTSLFQKRDENPTIDKISKQVEQLSEERQRERQSKLKSAKSSIGITLDQEDEFNDLVAHFDGAKIGGRIITFEEAIERAASQIRPGKKVSFKQGSDISSRPEDKTDEVKIPLTDEQINRSKFYTKASSREDFVKIKEQFDKKGSYSINPYNS